MRRLISALLAAAVITTSIPVGAVTQDVETSDYGITTAAPVEEPSEGYTSAAAEEEPQQDEPEAEPVLEEGGTDIQEEEPVYEEEAGEEKTDKTVKEAAEDETEVSADSEETVKEETEPDAGKGSTAAAVKEEASLNEKKADNRADIKAQADNGEETDPFLELRIIGENDLPADGEAYVRILRNYEEEEDGGKELEETLALAGEAMPEYEIDPVLPVQAGVRKPLTQEEMDTFVRVRDRKDYEDLGRMTVQIFMDDTDSLDGKYLLHQCDKEENEWEIIPYVLYEADEEMRRPYIEFTTDSFSPFIFADLSEKTEEKLEEEEAPSEETEAVEKTEEKPETTEEKPEAAAQAEEKQEKEQENKTDTQTDKEDQKEEMKEPEKPEEQEAPSQDAVSPDGKPLVETAESADEPLLAFSALSAQTRRVALGAGALPPTQEPVTEDGMTIEKVVIKWLSKSNGSDDPAGYGTLSLAPTTDDVSNQQWQVDFAISGRHEHEAGTIEVAMPAYIWKDRNGEEPGVLTLAVPEDPEKGADFAWKRVGDTIVFTNTHTISAATKVMLQGTFRELTAHEMVDMDVADGSDYKDAEYTGHSDELFAQVTLTTLKGNTVSMTSNSIDAQISTYVEAASASKTAYNPTTKEYYLYWDTPSNIPASFLPEHADEYCYVRWYVSGQAEGNQPFTMTVSDTVTDEYDSVMLGIQGADGKDIKSTDGKTVSAQLFSGYNVKPKTAYIWTAYKKSNFTEPFTVYTVHNTQTITVKGTDDLVVTTKEASAECSVAIPIEYSVVKEWDDNDNELGVRPGYQDIRIYRNPEGDNNRQLWKTVRLVENPTEEQRAQGYGEWSYTWSDEGKAWHYETTEPYTASGSFEEYYDEEGNVHRSGWAYHLKEKTYDPDEREWVFVNTLGMNGYDGDFADMYKRVHWQYDDPYKQSKRDRALNELLHGNDAVIPYDVWGIMGTIGTYMDNVKAGNIDAHRTDIVLEDYLDMMNNQRITVDDVDLQYVDIVMPKIYGYTAAVKDPSLPETDPARYYDPARYTLARYADQYTDAVFEAYINGQWVVVAEMVDGVLTARNGASVNGLRISLPEDTEQFRERVSTFGAATELKYTIGVRVHPTERVLTEINNAAALDDYMMMTVDNFAKLYGEENGEKITGTLEDWDRGYLHGRVYRVAAWQDKDFRVVSNDTLKKRVKLHTAATVTQQSNVLTKADYEYAAQQDDIPFTTGGAWYDLLPRGVEPDLSTVTLQDGDMVKNAYVVTDYQGTGRTLLVVEAGLDGHVSYTNASSSNPHYSDSTYPREGYKQTQKVEFDCYISWEDARRYGLETLRNTIAFSTDDHWIGNLNGWSGETDDPASGGNKWSEEEVRTDEPYMKDFEPDREDPSFVYAGADLITTEVDFAAETSIRKWVTADGSGLWSYGHNNEATVYEGGKYTYRINLTSDATTTTKDIIILDSLENYIPIAADDDYGDAQWRGYFLNLDVNGLKEAGIEPVVYYSTTPGLKISKEEGHYNNADEKDVIAGILNDPDGDWTTVLPEDPSTVTAFAIDCRKKADGSDFQLEEGQQVAFYVHMRAPAKAAAEEIWGAGKDAPDDPAEVDVQNPVHNAHAYNNVYLDSTQVDGVGRETHAYIHWDYVKVGIIPFNLHVTKEWNDDDNNDGIRPESVTLRLLADGKETGDELVLNEDNNWQGVIEHVLRYDYDTKEPGYSGRDDGHYITYSFAEDEVEGYTFTYGRNGDEVTAVNTHNPELISIPFTKTWKGDETNTAVRPKEIAVRLIADGVYTGNRKVVSADTEGNWSGVFENVKKYDKGHKVVYTVEEEYVDNYVASYDQTAHSIKNIYHPFGDLEITKTVENGTQAALDHDFTFTLVLRDAEGNDLTDRYDYKVFDAQGQEVSSGKAGNGSDIVLKHGQKAHVYDIPSHSEYEVTEGKAKGFTAAFEGNTGEILSGVTSEAVFTNTYASKGKAEISAGKELTGHALLKYQFKYDVYLVTDGGDVLVRSASNKENGNIDFGSFSFTDADDGKTNVYKIVERDDKAPGYTYDKSIFYAKVTAHDTGAGTMTFDIIYEDADGNVLTGSTQYIFPDGTSMASQAWNSLSTEEKRAAAAQHQTEGSDPASEEIVYPTEKVTRPAVFKNSYHAEGDAKILAWKQLKGRQMNADEFTFELLETDAETGDPKVIQTKKNLEDGTVAWDPIRFTQDDVGKTFYYFTREVKGTDETVDYDASVFGYRITVIDNDDGTLSFTTNHVAVGQVPKYPDIAGSPDMLYVPGDEVESLPVFHNSLKDGNLSVSKYTVYEGEAPHPDQEFRFKVKFFDPEGRPVSDGTMEYELQQVENDGKIPEEKPAKNIKAEKAAPLTEPVKDTNENKDMPGTGAAEEDLQDAEDASQENAEATAQPESSTQEENEENTEETEAGGSDGNAVSSGS